jgi:hypothetical protein
MRNVFASAVAVAFVVSFSAPLFAETTTITGELIDKQCYLKDAKKVGDAHKECGTSCARKGAPMAILTSDGEVYTITGELTAEKNAKLVPHVGHTVELTGEVTEKDGAKMINATSIKMKG